MTATAAQVKERPILFSGAMVRAILDGRKTQTRRVAKGITHLHTDWERPPIPCGSDATLSPGPTCSGEVECPYGKPGDRLWVRESFAYCIGATDFGGDWYSQSIPAAKFKWDCEHLNSYHLLYKAGDNREWELAADFAGPWRPSIHMPRRASRITLEITNIRVERLQDISEADAIAEGVSPDPLAGSYTRPHATIRFQYAWDEINTKHRWEDNPWVWVVEFKTV